MVKISNILDFQKRCNKDFSFVMDGLLVFENISSIEIRFEGLLFLICNYGNFSFDLNNKSYIANSHSITTVLPELLFKITSNIEGSQLTIVAVSLDFIDKFPILNDFITNSEVFDYPLIYPVFTDYQLLNEILNIINNYYFEPKTLMLEQVLRYQVFSFISAVSKSYTSLSTKENLQRTRINYITDKFFELLNENGYRERNVRFYSNKLNLTQQYLSTLIKKRTGKTVKMWISFTVINCAKQYLDSTSFSIKEVSDKLEFSSPSLFCRYFKRCTGQTPIDYKIK